MCNTWIKKIFSVNSLLSLTQFKRFILSLLTLLLNQLRRQDVNLPSTVPDKLCINLADKWLLISSKKGYDYRISRGFSKFWCKNLWWNLIILVIYYSKLSYCLICCFDVIITKNSWHFLNFEIWHILQKRACVRITQLIQDENLGFHRVQGNTT